MAFVPTLGARGFNLRLMFKVNGWLDFWWCVAAWCLSCDVHPPLKHVKQISTPSGPSCMSIKQLFSILKS